MVRSVLGYTVPGICAAADRAWDELDVAIPPEGLMLAKGINHDEHACLETLRFRQMVRDLDRNDEEYD